MQWPYVITAEQWSAAGTFWGGVAQVGLVLIGWYAGQQWFRQKRVEGLHELMSECMLLIHDMEVATDRGRAFVSYRGEQERQFVIIEEKYVNLMGVATRCRYYDGALADTIFAYALHVRDLLKIYEVRTEVIQQIHGGGNSEATIAELLKKRRETTEKLFRTDKDPWYDAFVENKDAIIRQARWISWGERKG